MHPTPLSILPSRSLRGTIRVPGDKSITHRAYFLGALNTGTTTIIDRSPADDCVRTRELLRAIGVDIEDRDGIDVVKGGRRGSSGDAIRLDCGNSGTTARLAMGFLASEPGAFTLVGDASLSRRPMERVADPLRRLGARLSTTEGSLPVDITGGVLEGGPSHGLIPVASAQVHAALVLAALRSRAGATLFAARPMRDHTIRLLRLFGCEPLASDAGVHRILPTAVDRDVTVVVPGDFSSAAFIVTAALLVPDSCVTVEGVGLNPTRLAYLRALERMGADVWTELHDNGYEPVGAITARYSPGLRAASFGDVDDPIAIEEMIDELPLLALVATQADGTTSIRGAAELRIKESDRIASTASILRALGARVTEVSDGLDIEGSSGLSGGRRLDPCGDHRLAMMGAIGAMLSERGATIESAEIAAVSYPRYWGDLVSLGGSLQVI
jgi:3-phosphoshikimate 1-carboxyvinyltransferase